MSRISQLRNFELKDRKKLKMTLWRSTKSLAEGSLNEVLES